MNTCTKNNILEIENWNFKFLTTITDYILLNNIQVNCILFSLHKMYWDIILKECDFQTILFYKSQFFFFNNPGQPTSV